MVIHAPTPHLPAPPDATQYFEWTTDQNGLFREFNGTTREASGVRITVSGYQNSDGTCHRWVSLLRIGTTALTAAQASELATALQSAADEIQRLDHAAPQV